MKKLYSLDDVLIVPQYSTISSREDCDVTPYLPKMDLDIPIFAANMDTICEEKMAHEMHELGGCGIIHRYMKDSETHNLIYEWFSDDNTTPLTVSVGCFEKDKHRIDAVLSFQEYPLNICVDLAHGDSSHMLETISYIRSQAPRWEGALIAGNVCTYEGAVRLFELGADIVKVGVGPGSACTTRIKTGCGYPQLSAIIECVEAGPIIADGGIKNYGDVAKALSAGAASVMIGGLLAGTDCVPNWDEGMPVEFRGMASKKAREDCGEDGKNAEGISLKVEGQPPGSTEKVITELLEGLRSAMSYSACSTLNEFQVKSQFVEVTPATIIENQPHFEL